MEMQQMQLLEIHQQKLAIERYEFEQKILQTEAQAKAQQQQTERVSRDAKIYNSVMVPALQRAAEFEEKTQVKNTQKGHKK
jgi:hypothetical protein